MSVRIERLSILIFLFLVLIFSLTWKFNKQFFVCFKAYDNYV